MEKIGDIFGMTRQNICKIVHWQTHKNNDYSKQESKMKCPMKFNNQGNSSTDCIEDQCAWWSYSARGIDNNMNPTASGGKCALKMIAENLADYLDEN